MESVFAVPQITTTFYNNTSSIWCNLSITGVNASTYWYSGYIANASQANPTNFHIIQSNTSSQATNFTDRIITTMMDCTYYYCFGQFFFNDDEGTLYYNETTTSHNLSCSTTTTSTLSTTSTYPTPTYPAEIRPVWGLNESENMTGLQNTSGIGSKILGLSKTNFFVLASLLSITLVTISISRLSKAIGLIIGVTTADIFILVIQWISVPMSMLLLINVMAILGFIYIRR